MIVPLFEDAVWIDALCALPEWTPPRASALVVAPHPDDETLGAGALIATLRAWDVPVTVVAVTDGENAYETSREERIALRRERQTEQREALARLGVTADSMVRLHLADSGLHLLQDSLTEQLMAIAQPGMHLIAPWVGDFHPDHEACARAAGAVAAARGLLMTSYFFWTWHRGTPSLLQGLPVRRFVPGPSALEAQSAALLCHRSQLEHASGEPILPERLLGPARWPFEVFLPSR